MIKPFGVKSIPYQSIHVIETRLVETKEGLTVKCDVIIWNIYLTWLKEKWWIHVEGNR